MRNEEKESRKTFHSRLNRMVEKLERDIAEGVYGVGDPLPSETALAELYKMGPRSVRKGIDLLVERGMVVKERRVGAKVVKAPELARVTLVIACYATVVHDFALEPLIADFQAQHPSISVKTILVNTDHYYMFSQMLDSGVIDAVTLNQDTFQDFAVQDKLSLLEPLEGNLPGVYRFLANVFSVGERRYVQPVTFSPLILCYNKAHFREKGLLEPDSTWTWGDMIKNARLLTGSDSYGLYFDPLSINIWPALLLQNGVKFERSANGRFEISPDGKFMECMRFYREIVADPSVFPPSWNDREIDFIQRFREGRISMTVIGYSTLTRLKGSGIDYDISPMPFIHHPLTNAISIGVGVNGQSRHKEAARTFMEYLRSPRAQRLIGSRSLSIPVHKEVADEIRPDDGERPSRYNLFKEIMPSFRVQQDLNLANWQLRKMSGPLQLYLSGQIDDIALCERLERTLS
ncbi:extracellular solute-binding protein [Paenibacillus mesophilus]|uniref:extracellular solute-binding protein n=1 Tax=Paenibacillus mesophilus TaxID=2582849 RepID=UPI00110D83B6|nr:extracellular solute-binding protein [Paenibacillus mesophilus]TMV43727.1 extracellular solute-binding protein [Paenibacillus mesophilus]